MEMDDQKVGSLVHLDLDSRRCFKPGTVVFGLILEPLGSGNSY